MYFSNCSRLCSTSAGVRVKIFFGGKVGAMLLPYSFFICQHRERRREWETKEWFCHPIFFYSFISLDSDCRRLERFATSTEEKDEGLLCLREVRCWDESQVYLKHHFNSSLVCQVSTFNARAHTHAHKHLQSWVSSVSKLTLSSSYLTHFFLSELLEVNSALTHEALSFLSSADKERRWTHGAMKSMHQGWKWATGVTAAKSIKHVEGEMLERRWRRGGRRWKSQEQEAAGGSAEFVWRVCWPHILLPSPVRLNSQHTHTNWQKHTGVSQLKLAGTILILFVEGVEICCVVRKWRSTYTPII